MKAVSILGTRGIPAQHGGFETFAEYLALYLVDRGWKVTVYCQDEGHGEVHEDHWRGVNLVHIPVSHSGAIGTIIFDWKSTLHATREKRLILTLGYNTALFCALYFLKKIPNLINMDGIEWRREKWSLFERTWLHINERLGCWFGSHLIADHPEIKKHLSSRVTEDKITMIPYGANRVESADASLLDSYSLTPNEYALVIARPEPENSILEIVSAFSQKARGIKLVLLGNYMPDENEYHKNVLESASNEVCFLGAIYDKTIVDTLRFHARLYVHGHQVGGTNPSLVEALGAGNAVLAHDNRFNRWVAGEDAHYFKDQQDCVSKLDQIIDDNKILEKMKRASIKRYHDKFTWGKVLLDYETLLKQWAN